LLDGDRGTLNYIRKELANLNQTYYHEVAPQQLNFKPSNIPVVSTQPPQPVSNATQVTSSSNVAFPVDSHQSDPSFWQKYYADEEEILESVSEEKQASFTQEDRVAGTSENNADESLLGEMF
jgi:hypothetical protein